MACRCRRLRLGRWHEHSAVEPLLDDLIEQHDILIRDAANFRGLDHRYVRLATQRPEHNRLLVEALRAWMAA